MPNWKKVIVSGSNAVLNNITSSGNISASGILYGSSATIVNTLYLGGQNRIDYNNDDIRFIDTGIHVAGGHITASGNISSSGTVQGLTGSFQALVGDTSQATSLEVDGPITASGGIISDNIETFWTSFNVDGDANFATSIYGPNTQGINYYFWNKNWTSTTSDGGNPTGDHVHRSEINSGWYVPYKIKIVALCGGLHDGGASATSDCEVGLWNTAASFKSADSFLLYHSLPSFTKSS